MKRGYVLVLAVGLLLGADDPKVAAIKRDMKKLQGNWIFLAVEENGVKVPEKQLKERDPKKVRWIFKDATIIFQLGSERATGTYRLDPTRNPPAMDIVDCFGKGKTVQCIYAVEGDTLKLCVGNKKGGDRPNAFAAKAGTERASYVLKRWIDNSKPEED
jgi:uncharacterized protein (TIGR03067 family)